MRNNTPQLIPLTQNQYAFVDCEDYEYLNQWKWRAQKNASGYYAVRQKQKGKKRIFISMATVVLGQETGKEIDHINGNGTDNRRSNLRFVTHSQNAQRKRIIKKSFSSNYKGVAKLYRRLKDGKQTWIAQIMKAGKMYYLGTFSDEILAAKAYDHKALELFGEYARINFPLEAEMFPSPQ